MSSLLYIEHKNRSPEIARQLAVMTERDHLDMIQGIEDGLYETRNFAKEWVAGQSEWKPLNPEYVAEKEAKGYSEKIWVRKGDTIDALSHKATINSRSSVVGQRREVHITRLGGGIVEAIWRILAPAAGGNFFKTNAIRKWLHASRIRPEAQNAAQRNVMEVCTRYMARILGQNR